MARQHAFPDFPGVSTYTDRKGETRYRFRNALIKEKTFKAAFGTADFDREFAGFVAEVNAKAVLPAAVVANPVPVTAAQGLEPKIGDKTFRHAWILLKDSLHWAGLKPGTQRRNRDSIEQFLLTPVVDDADVLWADASLAGVRADRLQDHYERKYRESPAMAKCRIEAIGKLYDQAVRAKWIEREDNKTKFLDKLPMPESDANRPWEDEERAQFEACWALGTPARTAYEFGLALGARRGDICKLSPSHIKDRVEMVGGQVVRRFRAIQWDAEKGRKGRKQVVVYHEVSERLERALAALPVDPDPSKPFLRKRTGKPYPPLYLSRRMVDWTQKAKLPRGLTMHGLRHTLGRELAEQGFSERQIAVSLGHRGTGSTPRYTRRVNQEKVMQKVGEAQNGKIQTSTLKTVFKVVG